MHLEMCSIEMRLAFDHHMVWVIFAEGFKVLFYTYRAAPRAVVAYFYVVAEAAVIADAWGKNCVCVFQIIIFSKLLSFWRNVATASNFYADIAPDI